MSANWQTRKLDEFIEFKNGKTSPNRHDLGTFSVYGANGVIGNADVTNAPEGAIVVGRVGSYCGSVHYSLRKCWVSDNAIIGNSKSHKDSKFWFYKLQSMSLNNYRSGSGQPLLNQQILNSLVVSVPTSEDERCQIAEILGSFDDKIALNRQINQTLEAIAQAIFKSWFVDFDPVKAKIAAIEAGQDPLRAAMSAISGKTEAELDAMPRPQYDELAATAALFPEELVESELGDLPKGWMISQVSQLGDIVCGKTPSKANPEYFGEGIPFIKIPDMHKDVYVVNPSERLTEAGAASQPKKTLPSGTVCVSCIATVGKVIITHEPSQTNQQINSIVPKLHHYTEYLYFQMKEKEKEFHDLASGGSATLNMNTSTFSKVRVLLPSSETLSIFSTRVGLLFSEILQRQKHSATLSELRDTLLPKLLSGELSVTDIEEVV